MKAVLDKKLPKNLDDLLDGLITQTTYILNGLNKTLLYQTNSSYEYDKLEKEIWEENNRNIPELREIYHLEGKDKQDGILLLRMEALCSLLKAIEEKAGRIKFNASWDECPEDMGK